MEPLHPRSWNWLSRLASAGHAISDMSPIALSQGGFARVPEDYSAISV